MAAPVWETPSGDLGTIPELNYFQFELKAYDSIDPLRPVSFELVAGQTPTGMHINPYGAIQGNPETVIKVAGVPANVSQASTSQFAVRAQASDVYQEFTGDGTTTKFTLDDPVNFSVYKVITLVNQEPRTASYKIVNQILTVTMNEPVAVGKTLVVSVYRSGSIVADRTFSITVIGENAPQILTTSDLGTFQDGKYFSTNIATLDLDLPGDTLTWYISAGALPPGLSLDQTTGIVSGYITPIRTLAIKHYNFTITVNDGKLTDARPFTMAVICSGLLDASSDQITADLDQATIDQVIKYNPILLNVLPANGEIGPYTHDNYFMYKFDGLDWDNDSIKYALDLGSSDGFDATPFDTTAFDPGGLSLPPGLSLDPDTGWLTGYIPFQSELSVTYQFYVKVYKDQVFYTEMDGSTISYYQARRLVQLTVLGQNLAKVTWATNIDLGSIANGSVSELFVTASADNSHTLYYELAQGQYNRLPAGLQLETNGVIRGRATFSTFLIDSGQTTFDANSFVVDETTFDQIYQFTVRAYDNEGTANSYRTFSLRLAQINKTPYENLYMVAAMARSDRDTLQTLLGNNNIIPTADLYRPDDSYFGLSSNLRMLLANGVNPAVAADYVSAMNIKHYGKRFLFGEIKTAKVYDPDATVRYEVVYVDILDDLRNSKGQNVSAAVNVKTSNIPETVDMNDVTVDEQYFTVDGIKYVYPNNFYNMRRHIIDTLGQTNKALPDWMAQKQPDGRILGFTTGCVLAYVKPGTADKIAFRIRESGFDFKQLNVQIERYVWDNNLSSNFDKATGKFLHDRETTFDVYSRKYLYALSVDGSSLVYPQPVDFVTPVLGIDHSTLEYPYNDLINDPASLPNYNRTTFDQNSMHFFPYRDSYAKLDQNDAYLKYPRTNVLR
jgi:hypothetical protein